MTHYFAILKIAVPKSYDSHCAPHTVIIEAKTQKELESRIEKYSDVVSVSKFAAELIEYKETQ